MAIKLGTTVTDKLTGVAGTAVSLTIFLYDCVRIGIQPRGTDPNKAPERHFTDERNLLEDDGVSTTKPAILGKDVTDSISGFKGIAIAYTEYMYAAPRVAVQPKALSKDTGKPIEAQDFDAPQLKGFETPETKGRTGGPGDMAPRNATAPR